MASMKSHKEYNKGPVLSHAVLNPVATAATVAAPVRVPDSAKRTAKTSPSDA